MVRNTLGFPKEGFGSPKFPGNPSVLLPCSQTPVGPRRLASAALRCCPRYQDDEDPSDMISFGAQSHGFGTDCLRFVPSSLMTTQDLLPGVANLSGWDFSLPTEFLWEVSAFRLPLPLSFAWRDLMPGSAGADAPAPPQTRTCGLPAYGSSSDGCAKPWACYNRCVHRAEGLCVPSPVSQLQPIARIAPFPTPRLRRFPFACFQAVL